MKNLLQSVSEEQKKFLRFAESGGDFLTSLESTEQPAELTPEQQEEQAVLEIEQMIANSPSVAEELGKYLRKEEDGETDKLIDATLDGTVLAEQTTKSVDENTAKWQKFNEQCVAFLAQNGNPTDEAQIQQLLGKSYASFLESKKYVS